MSKIRIKNFGPIKEGYTGDSGNEWMDIKKVTVFIGDQGSGKSSVAKLISSMSWFEKALNRGDYNDKSITERDIIELLAYQRVENYLTDSTEVAFAGDAYTINFSKRNSTAIMRNVADNYIVPKIMYVPAERNFLSTISSAYDVKGLPGPLITFAEELKRANIDLDGVKINLPIGDYAYRYDNSRDISQIFGPNYTINLLEASSGLQSLVPLFLVSNNLAHSIKHSGDDYISVNQRIRRDQEINKVSRDANLSEDEKDKRVQQIKERFRNKCFMNIVEEPEQNLFPESQRRLLNSLLDFSHSKGNELIMTTHSPYIINYLTLSVEAFGLLEKIGKAGKTDVLIEKVAEIVPLKATVNPEDLAIYELDEKDGSIKLLRGYNGLPSDENKLNNELGLGNDLFVHLLEIENKLKK